MKPVKDQIDKLIEQMKEEMGITTVRYLLWASISLPNLFAVFGFSEQGLEEKMFGLHGT